MKPRLSSLRALLLLMNATAPAQSPSQHLRYTRPIETHGIGPACAILDPDVFAHAAPSLKDLRLFTPAGELPYAITLSETADPTTETAPALHLQPEPKGVAFDLAMPQRPYTDVILNLRQTDFLWTATVSGVNDLSSPARTPLGTFSLFDLTARHLARDTILRLQESSFPYLHIDLRGRRIAPVMILGAQVPPSREAQTLYTPVARTTAIRRQGSRTVATFRVPARVPIDRVSIQLPDAYHANFSRAVRVTAQADTPGDPIEAVEGSIMRVHLRSVQKQQTAFPATLGVNLQEDATIQVAIEDATEAPLPIASITLEMRRRAICFTAPATPPAMFYGDPTLSAPNYPPTPTPQHPSQASLGLETPNPSFTPHRDDRTLTRRRPDILWFLLLSGLAAAGTAVLHLIRRRSTHHG